MTIPLAIAGWYRISVKQGWGVFLTPSPLTRCSCPCQPLICVILPKRSSQISLFPCTSIQNPPLHLSFSSTLIHIPNSQLYSSCRFRTVCKNTWQISIERSDSHSYHVHTDPVLVRKISFCRPIWTDSRNFKGFSCSWNWICLLFPHFLELWRTNSFKYGWIRFSGYIIILSLKDVTGC
jgi:hypothetical protein